MVTTDISLSTADCTTFTSFSPTLRSNLHLYLYHPPHNHPFFFFFNDTATTEIYTLSLHDALPICQGAGVCRIPAGALSAGMGGSSVLKRARLPQQAQPARAALTAADTWPMSALPASCALTAPMTLPMSPGPEAPSSATMAFTAGGTSSAHLRAGREAGPTGTSALF